MNRKTRLPVDLSIAAAGLSKSNRALRDLETRSVNAWKSEFQKQLALAESYLPTTKPQTREDRTAVADLIKLVKKKLLSGRPRGKAVSTRPRMPNKPPRAEKVAIARLQVQQGQLSWRIRTGGRRVPKKITDALIAVAIRGSDIRADEVSAK